jgi:hypothetical protein
MGHPAFVREPGNSPYSFCSRWGTDSGWTPSEPGVLIRAKAQRGEVVRGGHNWTQVVADCGQIYLSVSNRNDLIYYV